MPLHSESGPLGPLKVETIFFLHFFATGKNWGGGEAIQLPPPPNSFLWQKNVKKKIVSFSFDFSQKNSAFSYVQYKCSKVRPRPLPVIRRTLSYQWSTTSLETANCSVEVSQTGNQSEHRSAHGWHLNASPPTSGDTCRLTRHCVWKHTAALKIIMETNETAFIHFKKPLSGNASILKYLPITESVFYFLQNKYSSAFSLGSGESLETKHQTQLI